MKSEMLNAEDAKGWRIHAKLPDSIGAQDTQIKEMCTVLVGSFFLPVLMKHAR